MRPLMRSRKVFMNSTTSYYRPFNFGSKFKQVTPFSELFHTHGDIKAADPSADNTKIGSKSK